MKLEWRQEQRTITCSQNFRKTHDELLFSIWRIKGFKGKTEKVKYAMYDEEENPIYI
jgi:hypothetical protein